MGLFWPSQIKSEPSTLARFGRVGHWSLALCGAASMAGGIYSGISEAQSTSEYGPNYSTFWLLLIFGACLWLAGRGFRYIFSAE